MTRAAGIDALVGCGPLTAAAVAAFGSKGAALSRPAGASGRAGGMRRRF